MTGEQGVWLRRVTPTAPHTCPTPTNAHPGDLWRCPCGRRWRCLTMAVTFRDAGRAVTEPAEWERWWWPWPR